MIVTGPLYTNLPCTAYITREMISVPMNNTTDQLKFCGVTGMLFGQNDQKKMNVT